MSARLKLAVIGTGALGKEHARLYAALAATGQVEFVGVYDTVREVAQKIAEKHRVRAFPVFEEAAAAADAYSVVTPTVTHYEVARQLLLRGKHVLLEKPMTRNARGGRVGRIGARATIASCRSAMSSASIRSLTICSRLPPNRNSSRPIGLSPFPAREHGHRGGAGPDDSRLGRRPGICAVAGGKDRRRGHSGLKPSEDIANARLRFANGCIANLTVSRVSPERMRKIRVFSGGASTCYVSLDYRAQEGYVYRIAREDEKESPFWKKLLAAKDTAIVSEFAGKRIVREPVPVAKDEPLKLELQSFIDCVQKRQMPVVSGEAAKRALDLALEITRQIQR